MQGATGVLNSSPANTRDVELGLEVLEIIDGENAIVCAWYLPTALPARERTESDESTFVDLWLGGIDTSELKPGLPAKFDQKFRVTGNKSFSTTCGSRSLPLLEPVVANHSINASSTH